MNPEIEKELNYFSRRADELAASNFLLAEQRVTALLQSVAGSPFLCKLIGNCTTDFSYEKEFNACFPRGTAGVYDTAVRLPDDPAKRVSLVFCLLMDLDAKRLDLYHFLAEHFPGDGSYYESFSVFIKEVILPFKETVLGLSAAVLSGRDDDKPGVDASALVIESVKEKVFALLAEDKNTIAAARGVTEEEKKEIGEIMDGLSAAVETGEKEFVRLTFLSYKYAMRILKKGGNVQKVAKALDGAGWL